MLRSRILLFGIILSLLGLAACGGGEDAVPENGTEVLVISGRIEGGLRVLTFDLAQTSQDFTIYRGDYVVPELTQGDRFTLEVPSLGIKKVYSAGKGQSNYIKFPEVGSYTYKLKELTGTIKAVDYTASGYREVTAAQAAVLIADVKPFILDVRTDKEFHEGHLKGATLIPVQVIRGRLGELAEHKDDPVLIYCATGNRSTVAAKILADAGFHQVYNLRKGIKEWNAEERPIVKQ